MIRKDADVRELNEGIARESSLLVHIIYPNYLE